MRQVTQTRQGYGKGNCTEASIASVLEVDLEAVPELWGGPQVPPDAPPDQQQPLENCNRMWNWLIEAHGRMWCEARFDRALRPEAVGRETVESALRAMFPHVRAPGDRWWAGSHIMWGPHAKTGVSHCVVAFYGSTVWDPNPARLGIARVEGMAWLVDTDDAAEVVSKLPARTPSLSWALVLAP